MYYYGGYGGLGAPYAAGGYGGGYGYGGAGYGAAIVLVLFILLVIIIGARAFDGRGGGHCCVERERCCHHVPR